MGLDMYVYRGTPEERERMWEESQRQFEEDTEGCFDGLNIKPGKSKQVKAARDKLWASMPSEFWYWRKHPNLHGWMENLWHEKGAIPPEDAGEDFDPDAWDAFNGVPVFLDEEDLLRLKDDIENDRLPHTTGFFFGASDGSEIEDDLKFVDAALEAIHAGDTLYYTSSW